MREGLKTPFWRNAAQRLPQPYRERYDGHMRLAENWELTLEALIELVADVKALFRAPSNARSA